MKRTTRAWAALTRRGSLGRVADDTPLATFKTWEDADNRCLAGWPDESVIVPCAITYDDGKPRRSRRAKGGKRG